MNPWMRQQETEGQSWGVGSHQEVKPESEVQREEEEGTKLPLKVVVLSP